VRATKASGDIREVPLCFFVLAESRLWRFQQSYVQRSAGRPAKSVVFAGKVSSGWFQLMSLVFRSHQQL
jgi:hypothetical protein